MSEQPLVLIADDVHEMRMLLAMSLRDLEWTNVVYAASGVEALQAFNAQNVAIAFLDIDMPRTDGLNVLKQAVQINPDCFCVMVSAFSSLGNVQDALAAGAQGFIVKPYSLRKVQDVLDKFARTRPGGNWQAK